MPNTKPAKRHKYRVAYVQRQPMVFTQYWSFLPTCTWNARFSGMWRLFTTMQRLSGGREGRCEVQSTRQAEGPPEDSSLPDPFDNREGIYMVWAATTIAQNSFHQHCLLYLL